MFWIYTYFDKFLKHLWSFMRSSSLATDLIVITKYSPITLIAFIFLQILSTLGPEIAAPNYY